ncbi:MAG: acetolactate synthase small subunit [Pseudomonadota bacterium]
MNSLTLKPGSSRKSAYNLRNPIAEGEERHTLVVLVDNEAGVLARVIGLFSGRGYNIESLTVAEIDHTGHRSRITIVTTGTPAVINQIHAQLERMVPVHSVHDLTTKAPHIERELALFKIASTGERRVEALRMSEIMGARVVDVTPTSFIFELAETSEQIEAFANLMIPLGLVELTRTGIAAMSRGGEEMA